MTVKEIDYVQVLPLGSSNVTRCGSFNVIYEKIVRNFVSCKTLKPKLFSVFSNRISYRKRIYKIDRRSY